MTRTEHLAYCKKCTLREFTISEGILCSLTGTKADFEESCPSFQMDATKVIEGMPVQKVKPNQKRASLATTLIWAVLTINLFTIASNYLQYDLLQDLNNGVNVTNEELSSNDLRVGLLALVYLVVYIASAVTFIQWFRRAYNNLGARTRIDNKEGWAAGAWFVPIISLFRPYRIMSELFEKTNKLITERAGTIAKSNESTIIGIWWAMWIIVGYIANYSLKTIFKEDTIENLSNGTLADIIVSILEFPIGILAVWIITAFAKKERQLVALEKTELEKVQALAE